MGDLGACAETAVNVLGSAVGGFVAKVLVKYGAPWRVAKGIRLGKRLWGLAKDLFTGLKDFSKASREFKLLRRACNSFVAGTRVRLANGKHKPIEKIKPGDKVLATDPKTGRTRAEPVIAAFSGTGYDHLVQITLDTDGKRGHRTGTIVATEHHLFFDQTHHTWTPADRLTSGTKLRAATGKTLHITQVTGQARHPLVHDLTIASLHTYYVQAGTTPVLVHNSSGPCDVPLKSLHPYSSLKKSSLDFWGKQDTSDIVHSLRPGAREPLIAKPDGTIMNGNTRVEVLRSRGYDVNSLPRETHGGKTMTDEDFWDMDQ